MGRHRNWVVAAAALVLLGSGVAARAEVAAEVDHAGNYLRMIVFTSATSTDAVRIWSVHRQVDRHHRKLLNPDGDYRGDLWPYILEDRAREIRPWVVWPRFNGEEFDLAFSRWSAGEWSPIEWVDPISPSLDGNDVDPHMSFDAEGRPLLSWWRDENGLGQVYFSMFLTTRWMEGMPVSDAGTDSRYPTVTEQEDGNIRVEYFTPGGSESRVIVFSRPDTITDDLNPFESMTIQESSEADSAGR